MLTTVDPVKLIIQVPCLNEEDQLPVSLAELPREVPGVDEVEWMIVDDGSTDRTTEVAAELGVDHIVRLPQNRGLATAFQAGLDAALRLGADIVVNTDADNQYDSGAIVDLVRPIVEGRADVVVGNRRIPEIAEFSWTKKRLQHFGSWVVRRASDTDIPDTTSGFRAYSRDGALRLLVVNRYTYTIESIIQAGRIGTAIENISVGTNPKIRDSRLFGSSWSYIRRNAGTILRVFAAYRPMRFFGMISLLLLIGAVGCFTPFLWDWWVNGDRTGHVQSIILGSILTAAAVQVGVLAVVADLIASHRTVSQQVYERVRRVELALDIPPSKYLSGDQVRARSGRSGDATDDDLR